MKTKKIEMFTLETARKRTGMNQIEAAKALNVSVSTLRNYENGKTQPDVQTIKLMESLYGVPFNQLIFLES